ncbi:MAG: cysteine--tRNA ligase [Deltaproteobacteria bacterium]|nr:cysteine--tRNA ligase [Deltaproteobacteria bacterium]
MALRIYNSLTRSETEFQPLEPGKVRMYVCGITSYAPSHIGHARAYVAFDVVYRWLKRHYLVTFVRNFTDIDDKIIKAAHANGEDPMTLSERFIRMFGEDMNELGNAVPDVEPRVTTHIPEIVRMIETLEQQGFAYRLDGDVYYEVKKFQAYGRLSGRSLDQLEAGARVEVDERKRSPYDFALWKAAKPGEPFWDSPFGKGRPGWHIECSAMAEKYLGVRFDLHGGGKDLLFPHHENELAQSCAAHGTPEFANVWMHNGFVNLMPEGCPKCEAAVPEGAKVEAGLTCAACGYLFTEEDFKMSKSRGNFYPIREVLARYEGEALRLFFLTTHYRKPINFSHVLLEDAEKRLDKNYETLQEIERFTTQQTFTPGKSFAGIFGFDPLEKFKEAMDSDFNTAVALAEAAEVFRLANDLLRGDENKRLGRVLSPEETSRLLLDCQEMIRSMGDILGLWQAEPRAYLERRKIAKSSSLTMTPAQIEALIVERKEARNRKDFRRSDQIRDELKAKGIVLKDAKDGSTTWTVEES